jgi:hypothetical protein
MFNLKQCDVPILTTDDFAEEETVGPTEQSYPYSHEEMQFYLQEVMLCDLLGVVISRQYPSLLQGHARSTLLEHASTPLSSHNTHRWGSSMDTSEPDIDSLLQYWYSNKPEELRYDVDDVSKHRFLPAYIHIMFL